MIPTAERRALLSLARAAMEAAVRGAAAPALRPLSILERCSGAFVTLTRSGELRGCIGHPAPDFPLGVVLADCAAAAALRDPRFPPVTVDELASVHLEISVMTPPVTVIDVAEIEVGRHGLIVAREQRRGLLLPQVAVERGWTREEFLDQTCRKAGLPAGAWRQGAQISAFEAEIFGEAEHL